MLPGDHEHDPVVRELRDRITAADRALLAAVNDRVGLVRELRAHKLEQGWDFVDRRREERLVDALARENPGPLSDAGLRELFAGVLALSKREAGGAENEH
ncbi:MAG: chorismate mutase [Gaiellaceae bacterium]